MDRRQFISGVGYSLLSLGLTGCGLKLPGQSDAGNAGQSVPQGGAQTAGKAGAGGYDRMKLVVAEGKEGAALIGKGLSALGGIGALVKAGSTVVIKPNFSRWGGCNPGYSEMNGSGRQWFALNRKLRQPVKCKAQLTVIE